MAETGSRKPTDYEIDLTSLRLSVGWKTVLMPFEQSKFVSSLPGEGYVLLEDVRQVPAAAGVSVEISGPLARKGTATVLIDTRRLTLGVECQDPRIAVDELTELEGLLERRLSFDSAEHARFYELVANIQAWTRRSPIGTFRSLQLADHLVTRLSGTIGAGPLRDVSLRLIPAEGTPLGVDWWDFQIEPSFRSPDRCFRFNTVYRRSVREPVMVMARNLEDLTMKTLQLLESSNG